MSAANDASVVITGAGLVAALGLDRRSVWRAVCEGACGIGPHTALEQTPVPDRGGGEAPPLPETESADLPREARYLRRAVREAIGEAGLDGGLPHPPHRCGLILGTTLHGMRAAGRFFRSDDPGDLKNFLAPTTADLAAGDLGLAGLAVTTCSACSSGLGSVGLALTMLRSGELDLVIAGGYDPISEYAYAGFNSLRLVAEGPARPFCAGREGLKLGEGYGVVVLERAPDAAARGGTVLASTEAHYTHQRLCSVLGLDFETVPVDAAGRLDPTRLAERLDRGGVSTVVATAGTTGLGAVDPVADLAALRERHGFRLHVDAAYGGYFSLAAGLDPAVGRHIDALGQADSLVVDPHKHGLQPYGCGAVLFRDPAVARFYRHDSPYTYFTAAELHLGEISLECSRAGAAAVALWATQRLLPLERGGAFAADLTHCLGAARALHARLQADPRFLTLAPPDLDIVVWAPAAPTAAAVSAASQRVFEDAAAQGLHLALTRMPAALVAAHWPDVAVDGAATVTCLRCCLMKPEHAHWLDDIWAILEGTSTTDGV